MLATTAQEIRDEDLAALGEVVDALVPSIGARAPALFPRIEEDTASGKTETWQAADLVAVSRGRRADDLARAARLFLPRSLRELVDGLGSALESEIRRLRYLGPLRSYPPRHLAFSQHHDPNWLAGGGYAGDVICTREFGPQAVEEAFGRRDASGLTLRELVEGFCRFLAERCGSEERIAYLEALDAIQTGSHVGGDVVASLRDDELAGVESGQLVANVRLVNGATKRDTRQRLMLAFNTPFYPEALIASSVMAEGVDLQASCRHVIHHDLSWNPSDLEQRTGRVDRVGSKAERSGRSIHVYLPYVAATQDEKMYRVVTDRARWFDVTMGGPMRPPTALEADAVAERVPFPESAARELAVDLSVWARSGEQGALRHG